MGASGPDAPFFAGAGDLVYAAHYDRVVALSRSSGALLQTIPIASKERAVWGDRVLLLVEARETQSDSDIGDVGVYAIDMPSGQVWMRDDLGRGVRGGQQARSPIIAGDTAVIVTGGHLRAYRMK